MHTLQVLLVTPELATAETFRAVLEHRGHLVSHVRDLTEARYGGRCDVVVCDLDAYQPEEGDVPKDDDAFCFLNERRALGLDLRAVLLTARPTAETFRRALLSGESQILLKPVALDRLIALVEDEAPEEIEESDEPSGPLPQSTAELTRVSENPFEFQKHYVLEQGALERCARDICGYAMRIGIGPAGRCRIASALAEVLDNAMRHAYREEGGRLLLTAFADMGKRVSIVVQDFGCGFDVSDDHDSLGLARASALAESLRVDSSLGSGTRVELEFEVWPVRFEGDEFIDLSELDWLPPALTRKVLARIEEGDSPFRLSPALAVTVGRLLAAERDSFSATGTDLADGSLRSGHGS